MGALAGNDGQVVGCFEIKCGGCQRLFIIEEVL